MKYTRFLWLLPLVFVLGACSWQRDTTTPDVTPLANTPEPVVSEEPSPVTPTVPQEENRNQIFTYEDHDLGIKLQYPGSCYFNKGVFDCGDFTMSIWLLDQPSQALAQPIKTVKDGHTQIEYGFEDNNRHFALMAWYAGENKAATESTISKIVQSVTFLK